MDEKKAFHLKKNLPSSSTSLSQVKKKVKTKCFISMKIISSSVLIPNTTALSFALFVPYVLQII